MSLKLKLGALILFTLILLAGSAFSSFQNTRQLEDIASRRRYEQIMLSTSEKLALGKLVLQSDLPERTNTVNQLLNDVFLMQVAVDTSLQLETQAEIVNLLQEIQLDLPAITLLLKDFQGRFASGKNLTQSDILQLNQLDGFVSDVKNVSQSYEQYLKAEAQRVEQVTTIYTYITIVIMLLVVGGLSIIIYFNILRPINVLTQSSEEITRGNYQHQTRISSKDEFGQLGNAFNEMSSQLREFISNLEQRVADRTKALATVAEVGTATATILETDKLLQAVVDLTKERFNLYHSHIYLLDQSGENLVLASGAGEPGRQMKTKGLSIPLAREQSLVARAARERKGVTVNDVAQAPDYLPNPLLPDTRSELAVPMIVGEQVIGVFDVQSEVVGRFTDSDIAIQTTLAAQVASAVQNARSYTEVHQAQQLTRNVIDSTDDWIFIKDQDHRYQLVNQGYANSLHIPIADFIGKNDLELGFPEELVKGNPEKGIRGFWADDRSVMDGGVSKQIPDDLVTIDGNIHVFDTVKVPLRDADNKVWGVLAFARDMTERRNLEELNKRRAHQEEAINLITQKIQNTTSIESALQIAARELGHALGQKQTLVALDTPALAGDRKEN